MTELRNNDVGQQLPELQKASHEQLSRLIEKQWTRMWAGGVLLVVAVLAAIFATFLLMRTPEHPALLEKLDRSSNRITLLAQAMSQGCAYETQPGKSTIPAEPQLPLCSEAKEAIQAYKTEQQSALKELKAQDTQPKPEALSLVQLVGGTAVLAILGYLGLIRLQNLDQELGALRSFMFEQIKSRVEDQKTVVKSDVVAAIQQEVATSRKDIEAAAAGVHAKLAEAKMATEEAAQQAIDAVRNVEQRLTETIQQYPWLSNKALRDSLAELSDIPSVEQAHILAEKLRESDPASAIAVLKAITEKGLPGDKDDFHNAHAEAMRLKDPTLGLEIAEKGLESFPDDYDLMSDRAIALLSLGSPSKAKEMLDEWRASKPTQFARGWRPVVFYAKVIEATDLTEESIADLEDAFVSVTTKAPYEDKVWSAYARFIESVGRFDEAEKVLKDAIKKNPFSQEIHYVFGKFLMNQGRAEEAVQQFEQAIRVDFQDQFQPDVNQSAVFAMMAQAYEATGKTEQAKLIYGELRNPRTTIGRYAIQRLSALALLSGESPSGDNDPEQSLSQLAALISQLKNSDDSQNDD